MQIVLSPSSPVSKSSGAIHLAPVWEGLGPFPLGTRELPFLSSPLAAFTAPGQTEEDLFLSTQYGVGEWPSAYGINGLALWGRFQVGDDDWTTISWDQLDWDQLRRTEGWAALQYSTLLRTELYIGNGDTKDSKDPSLAVEFDLTQAHAYAIVPKNRSASSIVEWHTGDIYGYSMALPDFPSRLTSTVHDLEPGEYWVIVRALFEIRMFGDPKTAPPRIRFRFGASLAPPRAASSEDIEASYGSAPSTTQSVLIGVEEGMVGVGDIVDGWFWGSVAGLALRSGAEGDKILSVSLATDSEISGLAVSLPSPIFLIAHQIRPFNIHLEQSNRISESFTTLPLRIQISSSETPLPYNLPLKHVAHWAIADVNSSPYPAFKFTFHDFDGTAQYAMAMPPRTLGSSAIILATHGAGVEAASDFWTSSIQRQTTSWIVFVTGKTPWGYDWHGGSARHAHHAQRELREQTRHDKSRGFSAGDAIFLVGHSNGGQGAVYQLERWPDRYVGGVAAAGYLKIQSYVHFTQYVAGHLIDPALNGILSASLSAFDNDLHASNTVHTPLLLVHGREDDNVPVWHSRELRSLNSQWSRGNGSVQIREVPNESHWFDNILSAPEVQGFIESHLTKTSHDRRIQYLERGFTLTTANPDESGSMGGFRILELGTPGRLARLEVLPPVKIREHFVVHIKTHNVRTFSLRVDILFKDPWKKVVIDGVGYSSRHFVWSSAVDSPIIFHKSEDVPKHRLWAPSLDNRWSPAIIRVDYRPAPARSYGPIIQILSSDHPLVLVVPRDSAQHLSIAKRISHDAWVYARLDSLIVFADEVLAEMANVGNEPVDSRFLGNLVVIGGFENELARTMKGTPISFPSASHILLQPDSKRDQRRRYFTPRQSTGLLSLHPHLLRNRQGVDDFDPSGGKGLALLLAGTDAEGLERAFRLFPVRTGTPLPDWVIVGPTAGWKGAGGILGAGFWDENWGWNAEMSWLEQ